jgi:hypothetical protein
MRDHLVKIVRDLAQPAHLDLEGFSESGQTGPANTFIEQRLDSHYAPSEGFIPDAERVECDAKQTARTKTLQPSSKAERRADDGGRGSDPPDDLKHAGASMRPGCDGLDAEDALHQLGFALPLGPLPMPVHLGGHAERGVA